MAGAMRAALVGAVFALGLGLPGPATAQQDGAIPLDAVKSQMQKPRVGSVRPPADAVVNEPRQPGITRALTPGDATEASGVEALDARGITSDSALWGLMRHGERVTTQAQGPVSDFVMQDAGMAWQALRAKGGPLQVWGGIGVSAMLLLLGLFMLLRGRVQIEHGLSGHLIRRFAGWERFGHWLVASSFVLLALTGLNLLYGKDFLMPLIGKEAFAELSMIGKWLHNNVAWAFMVGLVWIFFAWIVHNLPSKHDVVWIAQGGGMLSKGTHPPSKKFNAGQKLIFWVTILLGGSLSASGLALLFPYELPMFAATFQKLNEFGIADAVLGGPLATDLTLIEEQQYAQLWHSIVAFAMTVIMLAHIYIGSVGMQGAFAAMGSGFVDLNWAREHHSIWAERVEAAERRRAERRGAASPAE